MSSSELIFKMKYDITSKRFNLSQVTSNVALNERTYRLNCAGPMWFLRSYVIWLYFTNFNFLITMSFTMLEYDESSIDNCLFLDVFLSEVTGRVVVNAISKHGFKPPQAPEAATPPPVFYQCYSHRLLQNLVRKTKPGGPPRGLHLNGRVKPMIMEPDYINIIS